MSGGDNIWLMIQGPQTWCSNTHKKVLFPRSSNSFRARLSYACKNKLSALFIAVDSPSQLFGGPSEQWASGPQILTSFINGPKKIYDFLYCWKKGPVFKKYRRFQMGNGKILKVPKISSIIFSPFNFLQWLAGRKVGGENGKRCTARKIGLGRSFFCPAIITWPINQRKRAPGGQN